MKTIAMFKRFVLAVMFWGVTSLETMAQPFFVDLSAVVNVAPEDDGIADNESGGWTDEGINDMFLYPPLPVGAVERNAHRFKLLDPAEHDGFSAVMLQGEQRGKDKPLSVRVEVPRVSGGYLYLVHHSVGGSAERPGYEAAVYTIEYADGTTAILSVMNDRHLLHWWTPEWWRNRERDAWPVHMGHNVYTEKWNQLIGLWATQWSHPHPDKPIVALTFTSRGRATPVIWAVTIDGADYHADDERKRGNAWGRVPSPPPGYFEPKLALERAGVFAAAVENGFVEGVRHMALIRNDWLAITVDPALTRVASGPCGEGRYAAATYQHPEHFVITSPDDNRFAKGLAPIEVGRDSYEYWNGDIGSFPMCTTFWHTYYLRLPVAMQAGKTYEVTLPAIEAPFRSTLALTYNDTVSETPVIKVNQVAYSAQARRRYAYLGWWAADLGAVCYAELDRFEVVHDHNGAVALDGILSRRVADRDASGEQVWEMDIAALERGRYHIRIPGLGRSASFDVGGAGMHDLFFHTQRAFYHQRCGFPLEAPYSRFIKEACHLWVYESGYMVDDPNYTPLEGEAKRKFRGGYHDAGDFDCFTYHLRATALNLDAYERTPSLFPDGQLNIAESGNGIPDMLDEARWALFFYLEQQDDEGGVAKGRCNDQDSRRQNHVVWGPFGIFQPDPISNLEYAAVAAHFGRVYRAYDAAMAETYIQSAIRAFDWAMQHREKEKSESLNGFILWAAGSLYRATDEERFHQALVAAVPEGRLRMHWRDAILGPMMKWPYIQSKQAGVDPELQDTFRKTLLQAADHQVRNRLDTETYRWGGDASRALGWGNGNGGGHFADVLIRAWWLTGDPTYFDAASINADFQLGCNPLSKTFITGMGARPPRHPQISAFLYEEPGKRGGTVEGITIYGIAHHDPQDWYPPERPRLRRWRDLGNGGAEISSEFTITETIGYSAMLYAVLYAADVTR